MKNTLRRRLLSRAALLMLATSAIVLPLSVHLIGRAFARVEGHAAVADAKRVELVLDGATREIQNAVYNYSNWDTMAKFVHGGQPLLMDNNFDNESLDANNIDMVLVVGGDGRLYAARRTQQPASTAVLAPAQEAFARQVLAMPVLKRALGREQRSGMLLGHDGHWYLTAIGSITNSHDAQPRPSHGAVVFVRELDPVRMRALQDTAGIPFSLAPASGPPVSMTATRGDHIVSERPLTDTDGTVTGSIRLDYPRPLLEDTRRAGRWLGLATLGWLLLGSGLLVWFVERALLRRLERMDGDLQELRDGRRRAMRLSRHDDELDRLGHGINVYSTELQAARADWERLAHEDALTDLGNRAALMRDLATPARPGASPWLALLDLDGFKPINDTHGHAAGDAVLREIAARLRAAAAAAGAGAYRLGGDEFALVVDADAAAVRAFAERLRASIARPLPLPSGDMRVTASIGIAPLPQVRTPDAVHAALRRADAALYRIKRDMRDGVALDAAID